MLTKEETTLALSAEAWVVQMFAAGAQDHAPNEWRSIAPVEHVLRASRHALTATLMMTGFNPPDDEGADGHLKRALTRIAMAIWCHRKEKNGSGQR